MGIPRLTALLHPYATPIEWLRPGGVVVFKKPPPKLIIDGPALAYFIYYQCLSSETSTGSAREVMSSYERLSKTVIEWLNDIEEFGITVFVSAIWRV